MNKARSDGGTVRQATSYGTQPLEIIMSYPLHLSNPITCIRPCMRVHRRACALALLTPLNGTYTSIRSHSARAFRFFTFLPRQTTGWKHKGFPAVASCAGVSLNKNERQGLINSVVRIYVCKIRKICKYIYACVEVSYVCSIGYV